MPVIRAAVATSMVIVFIMFLNYLAFREPCGIPKRSGIRIGATPTAQRGIIRTSGPTSHCSRCSEVFPYPAEHLGGGDHCACHDESSDQIKDHWSASAPPHPVLRQGPSTESRATSRVNRQTPRSPNDTRACLNAGARWACRVRASAAVLRNNNSPAR